MLWAVLWQIRIYKCHKNAHPINRWKYRLAFRISTCAFLSAIVLLCTNLVIGIYIRPRLDINIVMVVHGLLTFSIEMTPKNIKSFIHEIIITLGYHSWASNTNIVHLVEW